MSTGTLPTTDASADGSAVTESITRSAWDRYRSFVITVVNLSLFFVIWQLIALSGMINPLFFPQGHGHVLGDVPRLRRWHHRATTAPQRAELHHRHADRRGHRHPARAVDGRRTGSSTWSSAPTCGR